MSNYNDAFTSSKFVNKYTVTFKVPYEVHSQLLEITTLTGRSLSFVCRDLLEKGIAAHDEESRDQTYSPKKSLFADVKKTREKKELIMLLGGVRGGIPESQFKAHCQKLGIDPEEVSSPGVETKVERAKAFLRVLFTDRPDGLLGTRVIEIAKEEGFGENTTREASNEIGIVSRKENLDGRSANIWKLPLD